MIKYINKDITTVDKGVIAHGCNTQGVMGSGVAKFLRDKYPEIFPRYFKICNQAANAGKTEELLGEIDVVSVATDLYVVNGFTQHLYGRDGKYATTDAIESVLSRTYMLTALLKLDLFIPKIGAGRGGLNWEQDVEPIVKFFDDSYEDVNTYVCVWAE